jgi:hypothetical protein
MKQTNWKKQKIKADNGYSMRRMSGVLLGVVLLMAPGAGLAGVGADWNPLPDTAQKKCYDENVEISCPGVGQSLYGQDAQYQGPALSYQVNDDGKIVTDNNTRLMWMQSDDGVRRIYTAANTYCANLTLSGKTGWRLPSAIELTSIIDYSRVSPAINPVFSSQSDFYWTATGWGSGVQYNWIITFDDGNEYTGDITSISDASARYVRCVRIGP